MDPVIRSVLQGMELSNRLYEGALKGLGLEELHRRAGPDSSSLIWLAGHLVQGRYGMSNLAGLSDEAPWQELFKRYSKIGRPDEYPDLQELIHAWDEIGRRVAERLPEMSEDELNARSPRRFPVADRSVRAGLAFLLWHETYHIGQMGYLRKWLGYDSLVG